MSDDIQDAWEADGYGLCEVFSCPPKAMSISVALNEAFKEIEGQHLVVTQLRCNSTTRQTLRAANLVSGTWDGSDYVWTAEVIVDEFLEDGVVDLSPDQPNKFKDELGMGGPTLSAIQGVYV